MLKVSSVFLLYMKLLSAADFHLKGWKIVFIRAYVSERSLIISNETFSHG